MADTQSSVYAPAYIPSAVPTQPHIATPARTKVFIVQPPPQPKASLRVAEAALGQDSLVAVGLEHTPGHRNCPACMQRTLTRSQRPLAEMTFPDAFEAWFTARHGDGTRKDGVHYITANSESRYRDYAKALNKFFSELTLTEIHDGHLRIYQEWRATNYEKRWARRSGQNSIRKEVGLLVRIMKAARVWGEDMKESYQPLPIKLTDIRRALSPEEQNRLLGIMAGRDEWLWVYYYTVVALCTCASTYEMRMLRLKDVDLAHRMIRVGPEASKNKFRNRTIPLESEAAVEAMLWLVTRAKRLGASEPEHHVFPFGVGNRHTPDPTRPMTEFAMKQPWNWVRKKAGLPLLRVYDLRHTAITRMAEAGVPIATIMAFAGHVSVKMSQHYTTISTQAMRVAMNTATAHWAIQREPIS